ncbi:MAG: hypothetical protein IJP26_03345 [Clostridia bacterium]|nr:hypothetical protein [Clostridia bacterium]
MLFFLNKFKEILFLILIFGFAFLLIINPAIARNSAYEGMIICGSVLIPSLFPFSVISIFLHKTNFLNILPIPKKFSHYKTVLSIFIISIIGGYPIGAKIISEEYKNKNINKTTANYLLYSCVCGGPSFIILTVGCGIFKSFKLGLIFYISNILSSLIIFIFLKNKIVVSKNNKKLNNNISNCFVDSVAVASSTVLNICSYVILTSTLIGIINSSCLNNFFKNVIISITEITNATINIKNIYLISFLLGFGGICVILQLFSQAYLINPNIIKIIISRIISGILSAFLTFISLKIWPVSIETISNSGNLNIILSKNSIVSIIVITATVIVFLISVNNKKFCGKFLIDIF